MLPSLRLYVSFFSMASSVPRTPHKEYFRNENILMVSPKFQLFRGNFYIIPVGYSRITRWAPVRGQRRPESTQFSCIRIAHKSWAKSWGGAESREAHLRIFFWVGRLVCVLTSWNEPIFIRIWTQKNRFWSLPKIPFEWGCGGGAAL